MKNGKILFLCQSGIIAAFYTVLTCLAAAFGLSGGAIQIRVSEALCILPFFFPAAVPGLTVGCFLSNLLTGALWQDVVFGTLATFLGAFLGRLAGRVSPYLVPLPTVAANLLIIPPVLAWAYGVEKAMWVLCLTVGIGELISAYGLGILLFVSLRKYFPPAEKGGGNRRKL